MGLQQHLDVFKAEVSRTAPAGRLYTRQKSTNCVPVSRWSARSELATKRLISLFRTRRGGMSRLAPC